MVERSNIYVVGELEEEEKKPTVKRKRSTRQSQSKTTLVLQVDVILNITGKVSGKKYTFPGAGSQVDVDTRDVDQMLKKMSGNSCCPGSVGSYPYFSVIKR